MSRTSGDLQVSLTLRLALALMLAFILWALPLQAQLFRGFVSGTVTDAQDLVIVGVQVTITNQDTNLSNSTATNAVGFYRFAALEPGVYSVEFRISDFANQKFENVSVSTSQERVINAALRPSALATEIQVTAPGVELTKTTPNLDQVFSERILSSIPISINGEGNRDVTRFALLAPTAIRAPGQNEFAVNGQRSRNTNFSIDGVDNNDNSVTQHSTQPIPEAIKEIQIQAVTFSAEFGRNTGAQVNMITKNGTNDYRGEVWDYYRGNWLEPLSLANQRALLKESPRLINHQFGGDVGGPVIRDRTFFFGLVQGNLRREAPNGNSVSANIPTPAGYAALQTVPLRPGQPGQTAESRQAVLQALSFLPEIHSQVGSYENLMFPLVNGIPIEVGTIRFPIAQPQNNWYGTGRVDHRLSAVDQLSYRFHVDNRNQTDEEGNRQFGSKWSAANVIKGQNHGLGYTRTFSQNFINEARVAYNRRDLDFPERDPISPTITLANQFVIGGANNFPQRRVDEVYQFQNLSTRIAGRHSFKFGFDIRHNLLNSRGGANAKGAWSFPSLEAFLNNSASSLTQAISEPQTLSLTQWIQFYFFQDDIKVTRDFTLNMGIRYENSTVPFGMFGATLPEVRAVGVPGPAKRDNNNWGPRLGFAYSASNPSGIWATLLGQGQSSFRGGVGISYDVLFYNIVLNTALTAFPRAVTQMDLSLLDVFPTLKPKTATATLNPLNTFVNTPEDIQHPTTHYWTLSLQRQFGANYVAEAGYSGNRSYHTLRQNQGNIAVLTPEQAALVIATGDPASIPVLQQRRRNPAWGSRQIIEASGKGEYHAAYLRFNKKFSHGMQMGANYTFSATFSNSEEVNLDVSSPFNIVSSSPQTAQDFRNIQNEWSRSVFDRPHRLTVHYLYEIPWFSNSPAALRQMFSGWQVSGSTELQSGQPFTIRVGVDTLGNANSITVPPGRPDYNPGGILRKDPVSGDLRTFFIPLDGTGIVTAPRTGSGFLANSMPAGGNLGRNTFRGPSFQNWNVGLSKRIALPRESQLQLSGEFINVLNHDNFQNPDAVMSSSSFGRNTAALITDARQIFLSAKIVF